MIAQIKTLIKKYILFNRAMNAAKAYDLWSATYDDQPANLVMALDERLFNHFIETEAIEGKTIIDIGCGTGRHWKSLLAKKPGKLIGYDVSQGMLQQLKNKFPQAETYLSSVDQLHATLNHSCDLAISNLTIGYIPNLAAAFNEWNRVLKPGGDIIITDFHPSTLVKGGKRTFSINGELTEIKNYIYPIDEVKRMGEQQSWELVELQEIVVGESMKEYFEKRKALNIFLQNKGMSIIYGMHLKKTDAVN